MAERSRRPSSELGSDPASSPPPAKKPRTTSGDYGESGESSVEPKSLGEPGTTTPPPVTSSVGSEHTEPRGADQAGGQPDERPSAPSPVPGPSGITEAEGDVIVVPLPPLSLLPKSDSGETSAGQLEPGIAGAFTVQASLMGESTHYQELSLIGNGAYGTVYKAKDPASGQVVALKKVRVPITDDGLPTSTLREIAALKQLDQFEHPHIVKLLDVCQGLSTEDERSETVNRGLTLWLVFEHVERDLASFMASCPPPGIPGNKIKQMSREILLGVDFLHSHRIVHRDLKPQNLLVTSQGRIKIADFGLAKIYDFEMRLTSVVVTLWYRSPEVLLGCAYATPVDIWSVGCILAELSRLEPLFPGTSEGDQLDRIFQVIGTPSQQEWPEDVSLGWTAFPHRQPVPLRSVIPDLPDPGLDLIQKILKFNQRSRLTAAQALNHRYFTAESS
ncbi:cyclin-dependent kinase 4 [Neodiprion pinetum]|uniref:cyclin-dependent kinase 4 n=1 Tax=Neodiprion pinetum TaxID=441929 RepID=UPI001EDE28CD|nr:cyclin-dependent kinase 4-like [Neodiprion pinetum]XP_046471724.1 cyclin-dependent kinase 4-like [Neodiprion pinetum]XP_046471725.1 cyclin-dependent kinase 4-like [Neodiprion pinetum]